MSNYGVLQRFFAGLVLCGIAMQSDAQADTRPASFSGNKQHLYVLLEDNSQTIAVANKLATDYGLELDPDGVVFLTLGKQQLSLRRSPLKKVIQS